MPLAALDSAAMCRRCCAACRARYVPKLPAPEGLGLGMRADVPQRVPLLRLSLQHLRGSRAEQGLGRAGRTW